MKYYLMCVVTITFFSTIEFTGKIIGDAVTPLAVTGYRFLIGSLMVLPFALRKLIKKKRSLKDYFLMGIPGIINVALSMYFLQLAIFYGKAFIAGTLISINPVFVTILSRFFLGEKINIKKITGIILGAAGVFLIVMGEYNAEGDVLNIYLGITFSLLAAFAFAVYTVFSKKYVIKYSNMEFAFISFLIGSLFLLSAGIFVEGGLGVPDDLCIVLLLLYNGVFVTGTAYVLFFKALQHIPASTASMFFFLKPILVTIISFFWLNEDVSVLQLGGVILAGLSILFSV
ncbi:MAG: DMT family transporter [Candidatus Muiribacteriota bacterium]